MATIAVTVRYATNKAELIQHLQEGRNQIEVTTAAMKKMVDSLSGDKLIQNAHNISAAVNELGGVAKLTAAEAERLEARLGRAIEKADAMGKVVPDALRQTHAQLVQVTQSAGGWAAVQERLQAETVSFTGRVKEMALGVFTGQAAFEALTSVGRHAIQFLKDSIGEALEADKVQRQLSAAMSSQGLATKENMVALAGLAEQYANTTVHSKELLKESQALLVTVGKVMPADMDRALSAVTNLAAGVGIELRQATLAVAKGFDDNFGALKKWIPELDVARAQAEGLEYVLGLLNERFSGQAQAEVQSYAGQVKQLEKQYRDLQQAVGNVAISTGGLQLGVTGVRIVLAKLQADLILVLTGLDRWLAMQKAMTPQWLLDMIGPSDAVAMGITRVANAGKDINLPVEQTRSFTDELNAARAAVAGLTQSQRAQIVAADQMKHSAKEIAERLNEANKAAIANGEANRISEQTIRLYLDASKDAAKADQTRRDALNNLSSSARDLNANQVALITSLLAANKAESDIAKVHGFTAQQIRDVSEAIKARTELEKKSAEVQQKLAIDSAKFTAERRALYIKTQADIMDAHTKSLLSTLQVEKDFANATRLLRTAGTQHALEQIRQAEEAALKALQVQGLREGAHYERAAAQIREHYQLQRDLALETASTLELRLKQQGIFTMAQMAAIAAGAKRDFEQMRESGLYTWEQIREAEEQWLELDRRARGESTTGWQEWSKNLLHAADMFSALASTSEGAFGQIMQGISDTLQSVNQLGEGIARIASGDVLGGLVQVVQGVAGLFNTLGDALSRSEAEKAAADLRRQFGLAVVEGDALVQQVDALRAQLRITRGEAMNLLLPAILQEAGGLTLQNLATFHTRTYELMGLTRQGGAVALAALEPLNAMMQSLMAFELSEGGMFSQRTLQNIREMRDAGTELASVVEAIQQQANRAATAMNGITAATVTTQAEFDRLSTLTLATFNAMVGSGLSAVQAIEALTPSVDKLAGAIDTAGFASNAAFDQLRSWSTLVAANAPLLTQVASLNELLQALHNIGSLDVETFRLIGEQGKAAFDQLIAAGFTQNQALTQMRPLLETIIALQAAHGFTIDEGTQALIDQAREQGILAAKGQSTNDILMAGLGQIIKLLGGELPAAWRNMADGAIDEALRIERESNEAFARIRPPNPFGGGRGPELPPNEAERSPTNPFGGGALAFLAPQQAGGGGGAQAFNTSRLEDRIASLEEKLVSTIPQLTAIAARDAVLLRQRR